MAYGNKIDSNSHSQNDILLDPWEQRACSGHWISDGNDSKLQPTLQCLNPLFSIFKMW
jgi:hypothetical protein